MRSNGGDVNTSGSNNGSSSGSENGSSSGSNNPNCPGPGQVVGKIDEIPCDDSEECSKDCVDGTPVCLAYSESNGVCSCSEWKTPMDCHCKPKCEIADPVHYPYCCEVTPKGNDYPCLVTCTLPNHDKVDIEQNPARCGKFKDCCYGKRGDDGQCIKSWDPVETEPGDPRDYCKLKCMDVCNDKQEVERTKTASDIFPECCTPPIPISIACACCRDGAQNQPSTRYCEYFRRFFSCDDAKLNCPNDDPTLNQCVMTVDKKQSGGSGTDLPEYDPNHDAYLAYDQRFAFCSGEWTNRNCRYICRGKGILKGNEAPKEGIWAKDYIDSNGKAIENNYALQVHGNCADDEGQKTPIPWPPPNQELEECGSDSHVSASVPPNCP